MRKIMLGVAGVTLALTAAPAWVGAADGAAGNPNAATSDEVVTKVHEAVQYLKDKGLAGFSDFNNNKDARWVWKDSYVFVYSCRDNVMIAHPLRPDMVGKPILQMKDDKGSTCCFRTCARPAPTPTAAGSNTGGRNRAKPSHPAKFPTSTAPRFPSSLTFKWALGSTTTQPPSTP